MTQVQHSKQKSGLDVGKLKDRRGDLLFVGSGDVFNGDLAHRVFRGYQLRTISQAMGLPEALKHLESKIVDLVLLGREFLEEDSSQFVLAARRRGFSGLILRVASIPGYKEIGEASPSEGFEEKAEAILSKQESRRSHLADGPAALTARERQVLTRVSEGWSNAEIARSLKSSESAIKGVLQRLFHKLGVRKRAQRDSSAASPPAGSATKGFLEDPLHPMLNTFGMRRQNEAWNDSISFSARQRDVLTRVSEGWTNRQVARHLRCTEGAVKATLQQLFRKIGVRNRAQIVRVAFEKGLIDAEGSARGRPYRAREVTNLRVSPGNLQGKEPIRIGHFVVDVAMHRVWVRGVETHLTPKEFGLLAVFVTHPGELVRSITLCEIFWRNPTSKQDALRVLVRALRAKIEVSKTPRYVVTERSFGYRFIPLPSRSGASESDTPVAT
jgi:DNA-binding NarL/FixJ family response regulator/DNA-binding winged helix-turn-helix (wHTH) protein